ncbi:MAG TPA: hypothetical protein VGJ33_06035 [Candidatus Angelobacter sp.]|jgi:hypothetical protein
MKSIRVTLFPILLLAAGAAFAQSEAHKHPTDTPKVQTEAQKSFAALKALAGAWEGKVKMDTDDFGKPGDDTIKVNLRVTSRGNVLVHEMGELKPGEDPAKYDHPVTMFYLDGDKLTLVHYCDAGNRPRMTANVSEDGKTIEFSFLDLSGSNSYGHMHHAVFTIIDANHHIEEWTYMMPGDKLVHAQTELHRVMQQQASAR